MDNFKKYIKSSLLAYIIVIAITFVIGIFLPFEYIKYTVAVFFYFLAKRYVEFKFANKYFWSLLRQEMNPKEYRTFINKSKLFTKDLVELLECEFISGNYQGFLDICEYKLSQKLPDSKRVYYLRFLCEYYFFLDDREKLRETLDKIYSLDDKRLFTDVLYENLLNNNYEICIEKLDEFEKTNAKCDALDKNGFKFFRAVTNYNMGNNETAKKIFEEIAAYKYRNIYTTTSQKYIEAINSGEKYENADKHLLPNKSYTPPKRTAIETFLSRHLTNFIGIVIAFVIVSLQSV